MVESGPNYPACGQGWLSLQRSWIAMEGYRFIRLCGSTGQVSPSVGFELIQLMDCSFQTPLVITYELPTCDPRKEYTEIVLRTKWSRETNDFLLGGGYHPISKLKKKIKLNLGVTSVTSPVRRQRQKSCEFETSLSYTERLSQRTNTYV